MAEKKLLDTDKILKKFKAKAVAMTSLKLTNFDLVRNDYESMLKLKKN